jgi:hypothetical protein
MTAQKLAITLILYGVAAWIWLKVWREFRK